MMPPTGRRTCVAAFASIAPISRGGGAHRCYRRPRPRAAATCKAVAGDGPAASKGGGDDGDGAAAAAAPAAPAAAAADVVVEISSNSGGGQASSQRATSTSATQAQAEAVRPRVAALGPRAAAMDARVVVRAAMAAAVAAEQALRARSPDMPGVLARLQADRRALRRADTGIAPGAAEAGAELARLAEALTVAVREEAEIEKRLETEAKAEAEAAKGAAEESGSGEAGWSGKVGATSEGSQLRHRTPQRSDQDTSSPDIDDMDSVSVIDKEGAASRSNDDLSRTADIMDSAAASVARGRLPVDAVANITDNIREGSSSLIRRASNVGAGLEETVSFFVREDGSLDIEKLRENIRGSLDRFGETWQRLNGQDPAISSAVSGSAPQGDFVADAKTSPIGPVRDEVRIAELRTQIDGLEKRLDEASKARELVLRREDQLGKLIRAKEIRSMDDNVSAVRRTLAVRVLQLEMENIFTSLSDEVERSSFEMMEKRVMIAEFGDIDNRLNSLADFVDQDAPVLIDDDDVGILACDIQDLKMRLGIDTQLYSSRPDIMQIRQVLSMSVAKARAGADFYGRGLRLFWGDCRYAFRLLRRVATGYTLTPREVRTLRRTGRDILTLLPFTIILIAPLTPIGHVLIFSFLQRYWPDFFPSTFSEVRQSLMKRHETYAKSIQEESNGAGIAEGSTLTNTMTKEGRTLPTFFGRLPFFRGDSVVDGLKPASDGSGANDVEIVDEDLAAVNVGAPSDVVPSDPQVSVTEPDTHIDLDDLAEDAKRIRSPRRSRTAIALDDLHLAD
jgi:hypothetical protein